MKKIIDIQDLSKSFGDAVALRGINLAVQQGDIFGIIGMSGAGKSTLIRCLTALERPSCGKIWLDGEELTSLSSKTLRLARKKIGMIFQHFNLFSSRKALDNIAYPLEIDGVKEKERARRSQELLEIVGLQEKGDFYPANLSGGEKQRVAIARALARGPKLLLCDEATSALDPQTTQSILELLLDLNQKLGLTIVLITHEMEVIKQICNHVAVLEGGTIIEQGRTAQLFAAPKHPTTKRFLQNLTHAIPAHFLPQGVDKELLRLSFTGTSASQPVISHLIKEHDIEVNILLGGIDILRQETVGSLVVAFSGRDEERQKAKCFLENHGVKWERIE